MKKDAIAAPLLPFTDEEGNALSERLTAMDSAALGNYVESAKLSLGNKALDPSWRPRIQFGLDRAEAALLIQAQQAPVEAPAPVAATVSKAKKAVEA